MCYDGQDHGGSGHLRSAGVGLAFFKCDVWIKIGVS